VLFNKSTKALPSDTVQFGLLTAVLNETQQQLWDLRFIFEDSDLPVCDAESPDLCLSTLRSDVSALLGFYAASVGNDYRRLGTAYRCHLKGCHPEIPERRPQVATVPKTEMSHLKGTSTSTTPPSQTGSPFLPIVHQLDQHIQIPCIYHVWNSSGTPETSRMSCVGDDRHSVAPRTQIFKQTMWRYVHPCEDIASMWRCVHPCTQALRFRTFVQPTRQPDSGCKSEEQQIKLSLITTPL
jgi:hypothetical protein